MSSALEQRLALEVAKVRRLEKLLAVQSGAAGNVGIPAADSDCSELQRIRRAAKPTLPATLTARGIRSEAHESVAASDLEVQSKFPCTYGGKRVTLHPTDSPLDKPLKIGLVLSGGQAPGGHNVIAGVYDYIKKVSPASVLVGFTDGPHGIYSNKYFIVDDAKMDTYRNCGGFDMLGSGRHKIEKPEEFASAMANCIALDLDGLIVIGGDDSNTNAAVLAEYFAANNCKTKVAGCPKTIDGDLKVSPYIPISFGFDTATRTFSEFIGNLGQDTLSTQKYYHFVRLMGRDASNIALECALQTRPNICLISEEIEEKKMTLLQVTSYIVDVILKRREAGKDYGIVLLPEGLIEFIPEFEVLIAEINDVLATGVDTTVEAVYPLLSAANQVSFNYLPPSIKQQILLERDPHGNVQVAKIETERLLAQTVEKELEVLRAAGKYSGNFFPQFHSFGYEGRSGLPSPFDATYCYALGYNAGCIIGQGLSGLMSSVTGLDRPVSEWQCGGVPITSMCRMEKRSGKLKPVIKKNLVELDQTPFKVFAEQRADWAQYDLYRSPGPVQFFSASASVELCITLTLELKGNDPRVDRASTAALVKLQQTPASARRFGPILNTPITATASATSYSAGQLLRLAYKPELCQAFASSTAQVELTQETQVRKLVDLESIKRAFPRTYGSKLASIVPGSGGKAAGSPLRVGVLFSGRQAPGGHDVLAALSDALEARGDGSTLVGFVGGTTGLFNNHAIALPKEVVATYRGQGGVELLSRTEDSIKAVNYGSIINTCEANQIKQLVLIGGSRTVTQAAYLAEYLLSASVDLQVVCVPVDSSGSLKNEFIETSVGFDTVTKVAGQIVGNNATDGASAKKYFYFIRLMGQEYSHVCMEVALTTKPNFAILLEEVEERSMSLLDIVRSVADVVEARAAVGKNYGTVLIPDGLIDAIPELKFLIAELDSICAASAAAASQPLSVASVKGSLTHWSRTILERLPEFMQVALLLGRGSDGKINVSQIETEKLLAHFVEIELGYRKKRGTYKGSFSAVCSFVGYQARGALPTNFDVAYAANLGHAAIALLSSGQCSGYVATVRNLKEPVKDWLPGGVPLCTLLESKIPGAEAQIPRAKVDLSSPAFKAYADIVSTSGVTDRYENPGPVQFEGPAELTNACTNSLRLSNTNYLADVSALQDTLAKIGEACRPGCDPKLISITLANLEAVTHILHQER